MPKTFLTLVCLCIALSGCAGSRPPGPNDPATLAAAQSVTVAPPYHDSEYLLRIAARDPAAWEQRRNVDGGEGRPDAILRLARASDGAQIDVLFLPKTEGEPVDWAGQIRTTFGGSAPIVAPGGDRATVDASSGDVRTRHVVLHLRGMAKSLAYFRLTAPAASFAAASADLDAVVGSAAIVLTGTPSPEGRLAQCLTGKDVRLYSTWWCGPCQMQQRLFGDGASRIDKTECSNEGEVDQRPVCARARITSYPTWTFPDGSRLEGVQSLDDLADHAGCPRPAGE